MYARQADDDTLYTLAKRIQGRAVARCIARSGPGRTGVDPESLSKLPGGA
jgi:hypothetical protein